MKTIIRIFAALMMLPSMVAWAQTKVTFEDAAGDFASVGVYDFWEASPFSTGKLQGNCKVVNNPFMLDGANASSRVLGFQRSLYGSNLYGARIDLKENQRFVLTNKTQYVHVLLHKPCEGRVMLMGLGKHNTNEWAHQKTDVVQFSQLATNQASVNAWCDMVFPVKGAGNIDIYSLVVVVDCESPHRLTAPFVAYIDDIEVNEESASRLQPKTDSQAGKEESREGDYVIITNSQRNGDVVLADGSRLDNYRHIAGNPLKIKSVPEKGFKCGGIRLIHGKQNRQSIVYGPEKFDKDGTFTIPGEVLDGNVVIEGLMIENKKK